MNPIDQMNESSTTSYRPWLIALIMLGALILIAVAMFLIWGPGVTPTETPGGNNGNPFGTPSGNVTPGGTTGQVTVLQTYDGETVAVPDITEGKQSFVVGANTYYALTNNQDTQGPAAKYDIIYGTDSSITVGLFKEPLGASRLEAEAELSRLLGLPNETLCTLDVTVAVPIRVNEFYSARNLGLSFCPGAVTLP